MDHLPQIDLHCRRLLSRMYGSGTLSNRDLREPWSEGSGFNPITLEKHLPHLKDQNLAHVERVKNSDRYSLTGYGEKVAAKVLASMIGIPVAENLNLLLKEANSRPSTVDDFAVNIALPAIPSSDNPGAHAEQIKFHKRNRIRELDDYNSLNLTGTQIHSTIENLDNLSSTLVRVAGADLGTEPNPKWETLCSVAVKLLAPVADPGLSQNDWQQAARREFELESTFEKVLPPVELPSWF